MIYHLRLLSSTTVSQLIQQSVFCEDNLVLILFLLAIELLY